MVMPGAQKSFDQFRADDGDCRNYAQAVVGGPGQQVEDRPHHQQIADQRLEQPPQEGCLQPLVARPADRTMILPVLAYHLALDLDEDAPTAVASGKKT